MEECGDGGGMCMQAQRFALRVRFCGSRGTMSEVCGFLREMRGVLVGIGV